MVVFLDLDKVAFEGGGRFSSHRLHPLATEHLKAIGQEPFRAPPVERPNPNLNSFSAALACYP